MLSTRLNFILLFILTLHCNRIFNEPSRPSSPNCTPPQNQCQYKPTPYKAQPKQHSHFAYRDEQHLSMQDLCLPLPNDVVPVIITCHCCLWRLADSRDKPYGVHQSKHCMCKSFCILGKIICLE